MLEKNLNKKGLKVKVINASVSGDTSAGGLNRIDWTISEKNIDIIFHRLSMAVCITFIYV